MIKKANSAKLLTFGSRLREIRKYRNLTQEKLATELKVGIATIKNWERDKTTPSMQNCKKLANLLMVRENFLYNGQLYAPIPNNLIYLVIQHIRLVLKSNNTSIKDSERTLEKLNDYLFHIQFFREEREQETCEHCMFFLIKDGSIPPLVFKLIMQDKEQCKDCLLSKTQSYANQSESGEARVAGSNSGGGGNGGPVEEPSKMTSWSSQDSP
ncbi:MAG: helix-turn-helix transcriptional regulator [Candidatus Thiodiazotropha sp. 6PLUC7]